MGRQETNDMKRRAVMLATAFSLSAAASLAFAHHSHPYTYDMCRSIKIEGRVDSVQWKDPHTLIVLRLDDGTAYTVDWAPASRLTDQGIIGPAKAALVFGRRIAVTGSPIRSATQIREHFPDFKGEVNANTVDPTLIRRVDDSWNWTRTGGVPVSDSLVPCADATKK
jgi:Family of unknown function (DUF6152)